MNPSSRTPEGPLNFCPVCGKHCRIEPSPESGDATCPYCGSLLWSAPRPKPAPFMWSIPSPAGAERFWTPWVLRGLGCPEPVVVSVADIRALEARLGIQLPDMLTQALTLQNGGHLRDSEIDIFPIQRFGTLDHGDWAKLLHKEIPSSADRARLILVGRRGVGSAFLDYRQPGEPRIRIMDHIFDGDFLGEYPSFDEFVQSNRTQPSNARV